MENKVDSKFKWIMLAMCGFGYSATCMTLWMFYSYFDLMQEYFQATSIQMGYIGTITGLFVGLWAVLSLIRYHLK